MSAWSSKALAEVCQIKPPKAEAKLKLTEKELVSFVPMEDLGINLKTLVPTKTRPLTEVAGSYTYFANGDVLLAKITPCFENGKLGIAENLTNGIGFGSSEYIVFRPYNSLDKEWLYYYLSQESFRLEGAERMTGAVGHKRVSKDFIDSYQIPVPPIQEQQRIVAILDEAFEQIAIARANTEKNLQNARALFESHLKSALTTNTNDWKVGVLGDVCEELFAGGDVPKENSSKIKSGKFNIPIFTNGEKNMGLYGFTNSPRVTLPSITVSARGTIGYSEIRNEPFYPAIRLIVLTPKTDVLDLFFLKALIRNMDFIHSGTSIPQLTVPMIKEYPIKYPTLDVQKQLVKKLDKLNEQTQHLESLYQRKLNALDALKKSLLHKAFAGEL